MSSPDLEQQFLAFRLTGDPRAIAAVYDEVAPELLLAAAHLGNKEGDAEDLVQATFLAAMEQAEAYDETRPLLPWLVGILINQGRYERRRRTRKPDAERLPMRADEDPAEAAEHAEFADELARRLRALPEYYRQVLTLRFVHGMAAIEIAHSLGLSPETVKTRLRRGQDLLRRGMPVGFAAALAGMITAAPRLPAVRETVLTRATELQAARLATLPGAAAGTSGSSFAKVTTLLGTLVLVGGLLSYGWPGNGVIDPVADTQSAPGSHSDETPVESTAVAWREPTPAPIAAGHSALSLRLRWWNGEPAAAANVALVLTDLPNPQLHERVRLADARGRLNLEDLTPGTYRLRVLRAGDDQTLSLSPGQRTHEEITIPRGIDVQGRVVGAGGQGLAGARILVSAPTSMDELQTVAVSDAKGRFSLRSVAPGRSISVQHAGYAALPLQLVVGEPGENKELTLDLADRQSRFVVTGRVTGPDNTPIEGALVQVGRRLPFLDFDSAALGPESRRPPMLLRTGEDGRFVLRGLLVTDRKVDVFVRATDHPLWHQVAAFGGSEARLSIRLRRGRRIQGRVTDETGTPRPDAEILAGASTGPMNPDFAPSWARSIARSDARGEYSLAAVHRQQLDLQASDGEGHRAVVRFAAGGDGRWDPILMTDGSIRGTIVGPDARGLAGLKITALVRNGSRRPPSVRSDAQGRFVIEGCAHCDHSLWIVDPESPWSGCVASRAGVRPRGPEQLFRLPAERLPNASIRGRVVDADGQPLAARIALRSLHVGTGHVLTDPATGAFAFTSIPALTTGYSLYIHLRRDYWARLCHVPARSGGSTELGDIEVLPSGGIDLTLSFIDGNPVQTAEVRIHHVEGEFAEVCRVRQGRGSTSALAPGEYVLHVEDDGLAPTATPFAVKSGEQTALTLHVRTGVAQSFAFHHPDDGWDLRLQLDWCDDQGHRLFSEMVQLEHKRGLQMRRRLSAGNYLLRARSHAGNTAELRFAVTDRHDTPWRLILK